jgi:predicted O-methyltransferase YrrM
MGKIKLLIKYLVYVTVRRGAAGHGIHSPYVFSFNRDVLNCRKRYDEYDLIRGFRLKLMSRDEIICVDDKGAGSAVFISNKRKVREMVKYSSSTTKMGKLLFRLARHLHAVNVVELGTSLGFGTFCLALGSDKGRVYSIEASQEQIDIAREELGNAGITNAELIEGTFRNVLPDTLAGIECLDLVYFDGDHRKESVRWQFRQCLGKMHSGSVFVVGDINWSTEMNEAWRELCGEPSVTLSMDLFHCGLLFFRKGMTRQHFTLGFS